MLLYKPVVNEPHYSLTPEPSGPELCDPHLLQTISFGLLYLKQKNAKWSNSGHGGYGLYLSCL